METCVLFPETFLLLKCVCYTGLQYKKHCLTVAAAAAAKSLQSCPTLCDPIDGSPPGSPLPGILQARTLEWVAISFSNAWKWKAKGKSLSRVRLLATPWTAAYQVHGIFQARVLEWGAIAFSTKTGYLLCFCCYFNFWEQTGGWL